MSSSAEQNSKVEDAVSSQPETASHQPAAIEDIRAKLDPQRREFEESIAHPHELSLFRSFREQDSSDNDWDEAPPRRRFYLGAALAILTAGAIYMAWRSGQLSAQRPHEAKPAPAIVAPDSSASGQNPNANVSEQKAAPQTSQAQTPATAKNGEPHPPENSLPASDHREKSIQRVSSVTEQTPAPQPLIDNGKEELAVAERYLNGTNGQRRDSGEAAKWLWKSISKHNGEASVLLADLYLKGDGVSKNCDQARVLLDTAGRKGVAGAGMRLRNLQAFGCQ
ncbi:MAG TPA: hypothetical protein VHW45_15650 [Candidatus Sulfotelmatobacter sp.]|jgi:TPR repeat protein|nr:hypothetical protein [Candidatus Sulfotelmatobacter sp.]